MKKEKRYAVSKKSINGSTIYIKCFELDNYSVKETNGLFFGEGYANTKNKPDSYGDIPTNLNGEPVYDLSRINTNPVMLMDHINSSSSILGKFIRLEEDKRGLYFKNVFRPLGDIYNPCTKDSVSAFISGYAKALSIGGNWFFEDEKNPTHLTRAFIHEISGVAVGADDNALFVSVPSKKSTNTEDLKGKNNLLKELDGLVALYRKTTDRDCIEQINGIASLIRSKKNG